MADFDFNLGGYVIGNKWTPWRNQAFKTPTTENFQPETIFTIHVAGSLALHHLIRRLLPFICNNIYQVGSCFQVGGGKCNSVITFYQAYFLLHAG